MTIFGHPVSEQLVITVLSAFVGMGIGIGGTVLTVKDDISDNTAEIKVIKAEILKKDDFYAYMDKFKKELKADFEKKQDK